VVDSRGTSPRSSTRDERSLPKGIDYLRQRKPIDRIERALPPSRTNAILVGTHPDSPAMLGTPYWICALERWSCSPHGIMR